MSEHQHQRARAADVLFSGFYTLFLEYSCEYWKKNGERLFFFLLVLPLLTRSLSELSLLS